MHGSQADRALNSKRSAEFIVYRELNPSQTSSAPIPFSWVNRIIVPVEAVRHLTDDQEAFLVGTGKVTFKLGVLADANGYFLRNDLLKHEKGFIRSIGFRAKSDSQVVARMSAAMQAIIEFEQQHPELIPTHERFSRPAIADRQHGTLHSVRVMFWAAFLVQYIDEADRKRIMPLVLASAAVHDTCRETDQEDEEHGTRAAEAHQHHIQALLQSPELIKSCLNAVRMHCKLDESCQDRDLVWTVLKDADALDRGRFGVPKKPGGCDPSLLRTDVLKADAQYGNISWMASYVASMTRYTPVGQTPCADFCNALCEGVKAYQKGV